MSWGAIEEIFNEHLGATNEAITHVAMMENIRGEIAFFKNAPQEVPRKVFYEGEVYFLRETFDVKESQFHRFCDNKMRELTDNKSLHRARPPVTIEIASRLSWAVLPGELCRYRT